MGSLSDALQPTIWNASFENESGFLPATRIASLGNALDCKDRNGKVSNICELIGGDSVAHAVDTWRDDNAGGDVLHYLCQDTGNNKKGVFKNKMEDPFARLLAISETQEAARPAEQSPVIVPSARRQRKGSKPLRVPPLNTLASESPESTDVKGKAACTQFKTVAVCKNLACKADLSLNAPFCRRCSCCLCKNFDDNKDPSLWISCGGDSDIGCGLSCHIECALNEGVAGVVIRQNTIHLDGTFCCPSCERVTTLLGSWKKQVLVAKEARRVDILCYRLFLSYRLLKDSQVYKGIHSYVDKAVKILEAEVGSMVEGSANLRRGIVNRLSSNVKVQELICLALLNADALHASEVNPMCSELKANDAVQSEAKCYIHVSDTPTSEVEKESTTAGNVGVMRKCNLGQGKDVCNGGQQPRRGSQSCSPESQMVNVDTEENPEDAGIDEHYSREIKDVTKDAFECGHFPCQSRALQVHSKELCMRKKVQTGVTNGTAIQRLERASSHLRGAADPDISDHVCLEFSVKVIRWLECNGHLNGYFRMKFLTWYSLRASEKDKRVVSVYIDALQDDPASLAAQLVDTFEDIVASKRQRITSDGGHSHENIW